MNSGDRCKRCGAERSGSAGDVTECRACRTINGLPVELERYVEAVLSEPAQPPKSPFPGLTARWRGQFGQGPAFRDARRERGVTGELEIDSVQRRMGRELFGHVIALGSVVCTGWLLYRVGIQGWLLAEAAVVLLLAYGVLGRLRLRSTLRVRDGVLEFVDVKHGFGGRRIERIPAAEVRQLYVVHVPETPSSIDTFELRVRRHDGSSSVLERYVGATVPVLMEALAERALGIRDEAEEGELDRQLPIRRRAAPIGAFLAVLVALSVGSVAAAEIWGGDLQPIFLAE